MRGFTYYSSLALGAIVMIQGLIAIAVDKFSPGQGGCIIFLGAFVALGAYWVQVGMDAWGRMLYGGVSCLMLIILISVMANGQPNLATLHLFAMTVVTALVAFASPEEKVRSPRH